MVSSITLFIVGSVITANNVINAFTLGHVSKAKISTSLLAKENNEGMMGRRGLLQTIAAVSIALPANAIKMNTVADGLLPDLPPEAQRSYLQYRVALQVAADYYLFDLQEKIGNIDNWGEINEVFVTKGANGMGQPNKIERDYVNPMRILGLSMPPDEADTIRDAQFKFERAMAKISKAVRGVRRDLPVEVDKSSIVDAKAGWEDGRVALNDFFVTINKITGLDELKVLPPAGPDQNKKYGRSAKRYFELAKKTKQCQNRGGPALSQAWGQLMMSGLLQENMDSCGIPDMNEYFYQS